MTWAPWDMPDGTFQRVYDLMSLDDRRAMRGVSRRGKALVNAHARSVDVAPAGSCTRALCKKDVKNLLDAGPMYQLRRLACRYGSFGLVSARRLTKTPAPRLRALDLLHSDLDERIIAILTGSSLRLTLEELRLAACNMGLAETAALSSATWPALRRLDISLNYGSEPPEGGGSVADALVAATPSLESLNVSCSGGFAAACLARLDGWPGLLDLCIEGLLERAGLPSARGLKVLSLKGSRVADRDFVEFIAGNSATLESLSLADCRVSVLPGAGFLRRGPNN